MKKTLLLFAWLLTASAVQAQHMQPDPVEPASKGVLPEMPVVDQAAEGRFGGLRLDYTTLQPFQGANWDYEAELSFPLPTSLGGDSYTLQIKRYGDSWETYNDENTITGASYLVYSLNSSYRLVLHGGDKDGWISNEVDVPYISIPSQKKSTQYNANQQTFVGSTLRGSSITIRVYHDHSNFNDYTDYKDDPSFVRTWYRRNPNTGAMTSTEVHESTYTVTSDDVGYEVVEVVRGDKNKTDFYFEQPMGVGKFAIYSSAEFFYEGFIVNTEYDIPDAQTVFGFEEYNPETGTMEIQPFAPEDFKVLAPGRYAITYPWEQYNWKYVYSTNKKLGICEKMGEYYIQPLYLWAAPGRLQTMAVQDGHEVEGAKINLLEKNMQGRMQYVYTSTDGTLNAASYITLYAKAVNVGDDNLPTYYPSALLWTEAQAFDAQSMFRSEGGPKPVAIEVRRNFAPLGGQCSIEGRIEGTLPVATPLLSPENPSVVGTWNYYMTDENGEPIRTEDMLRVQVIINEDGTYVMNIPVWGEVQSGSWSWWNTGTTLYFQVSKLVKGTEVYEGQALLDYWGVDENDERMKFRTDISFNSSGCLIMDLFGLPGSVYEPAGGIVMPEAEPVYVYLRQKDGEIIAAALLQDDGSYRFEQVPEGTYEVIPNIDGYDVNIQTVTISAGQTTAAIDDYILFDNDRDLITSVTAPRTDTATSSSYYDLLGRRLFGQRTRGIIITDGKKVLTK